MSVTVHPNIVGNPTETQLQSASLGVPLIVKDTADAGRVVVRVESGIEGDGSSGYRYVFCLDTLAFDNVGNGATVTPAGGPASLFVTAL